MDQIDQVDYNPAHWDRIEKQLDGKKGTLKYYIGGALLVGAITTAIVLNSDESVAPATSKANAITPKTEQTVNVAPAVKQEATGKATQVTLTKEAPVSGMPQAPISVPSSTPALVIPTTPQKENAAPTVITKKVTEGNVIASIKVSKTNGCAGELFYFTADVNVPATYKWTFGDGKSSELPNPAHGYAQSGKYGVGLVVTSLIDGKSIRIAEGTTMVVNPKPSARFTYSVDEDANFSRVVELSNQTKNDIGSQWIVDGKYYNEEVPRVKINRKGTYPVSLIVKNDLGCYDTITQNVILEKEYNLFAPNAFTPDGDNQNDDFLPAALKSGEVAFKMDIIDPRSNAVIYSSTGQPWDGTNNTLGRRADNGTYLWTVVLTRKDNSKETFKGNVSIIK